MTSLFIPASNREEAARIFQLIAAGRLPRLEHNTSREKAGQRAETLNLLHGRTWGDVPVKVFEFVETTARPEPVWTADRVGERAAAVVFLALCGLIVWGALFALRVPL